MNELTPQRKKEVVTGLFATFQWKEFMNLYLVCEREDMIEKLKNTKGDKEMQDRIIGSIEQLDKLINYERIIKDLDFYISRSKK